MNNSILIREKKQKYEEGLREKGILKPDDKLIWESMECYVAIKVTPCGRETLAKFYGWGRRGGPSIDNIGGV